MYLKSKDIDLRQPFIEEFLKVADTDNKLIFITCDVGFSFLEPVKEKLGKRFLNLGITEPSAMVIASSLALDGWRPYIYSMINFVSFRTHEQVRNAICMHKAPVVILGVEGSKKYSFLGFSHNLLRKNEEVDFLKKLPGMKCYLPKTFEETKKVFWETYKRNSPNYIRL